MSELLHLDLHCHILPGIDDGAKTLDDSLVLGTRLVELGITRVVASSHMQADLYPNRRDTLLPLLASTQAALTAAGIGLTLVPGAEVRLDPDSCTHETWLTIGDRGTHLLVELPPGLPLVANMEAMLFDIQARGVTPIIAHPERQPCFQKDPTLLASWVERGMLAQGTLCVLAGAAGERAIHAMETMLCEGLIAFVGSDAHAVDRRIRDLDKAAERLEALVGPENARLIRFENPAALLSGAAVQRPSRHEAPPAPGLLQRLMTSLRRA